jgi:hypothetical protein
MRRCRSVDQDLLGSFEELRAVGGVEGLDRRERACRLSSAFLISGRAFFAPRWAVLGNAESTLQIL